MAAREALTAEYVRSILDYNPETGEFRWKDRTPEMFASGNRPVGWRCRNLNSKWAGKIAGTLHPGGHIIIRIFKINYKAHRLAWVYMTGAWPNDEVDHINRIGSDNKFANLREANHAQNMANRIAQSNNTSGFKGIDWHRQTGKWRARIMVNGAAFHLGLFESKDSASSAYEIAAKTRCGKFARVK